MRVIVLNLFLASTANTAIAEDQPHAGTAERAGASRPGTAPTGSQEFYAQIAAFAEIGKDLEVSALLPDGKFKLASADLSTKFPKWISAIEAQHQKIWSDCKEKPAGAQLNALMKQYVEAIAQETSEVTGNKGAGFIKDAAKDPSIISAQRFYAITAGIRAILDAQLAGAPADKKARVQAQNESLLGMMEKTNAFLAGIDPKGEASDQKLRETVLEKVKGWDLAKVSETGTKIEDVAKDALKVGAGVPTSIQDVINQVQKGEGLCWFDSVQAGGPAAPPGGTLPPGATETTTTTTTEVEQVEERHDDPPAKTADSPPPTGNSGNYDNGNYGTSAGYGTGYNPLSYDPLAYGALNGGYGGKYKSGNLNYSPAVPVPSAAGNYKVAAPPPAVAAVPAPAPAPLPISGGGFVGGGQPFPPMGGFPPQSNPMPFIPPPPTSPVPLPVPIAEVTEETTTEAIPVGPAIAPIQMPTQPPPPPPTMVNTTTVWIKVKNPDGTESLVPAPTNPTGTTPVTSPNPAAGTAPNVNAITGQTSAQ